MTYATDTVSIQGSAPIELYEFVTPVTTYRHTSYDTDYVFFSNTFTPMAGLIRASIAINASTEAQELQVTMPASALFIQENMFSLPRTITCRVRIVQPTGSVIAWQGLITNFTIQGRMATVHVPSLMDDALETEIPTARFQPRCNHFLYDSMCKVLATSFDFSTSVGTISGASITVASIGGNPDNWFQNGEIVRALDGERRLIVKQIGTTLTLNYPFRTLVTTNTVTLFAGCDHLITTCDSKFDNHGNFGGHPHVTSDFVKMTRLLLNATIR